MPAKRASSRDGSACPFCAIVAGTEPAHIVLADDVVVAFLDQRPVFPGHVLVVPREHVETFLDLPSDHVGPLMERAQRVAGAMESGLGADGSFVAINNRVSQSVAHLHVHVVPRRRGDGLRGFFWPRRKYQPGEAEEVAAKLRNVM
ncbi:MAG TPA: HIT family protein [Acidimicrobiales bacterium]|nr:HIT family protein [Acidimicrobiales bacterium]